MPETVISGNNPRRALVISDPAAVTNGFDPGGARSQVYSEISGGFIVDAPLATFSLATGPISPAASPTDIVTIAATTRTVRVTLVRITGIATTASTFDIALLKRSTLDTGGTSTTPTGLAHWTADSPPTALTRVYSANPGALGTLVGAVRDDAFLLAGGTQLGLPLEWPFFNAGRALIIPAGSTECLCINAGGTPVPGGGKLNITIQWSEDV